LLKILAKGVTLLAQIEVMETGFVTKSIRQTTTQNGLNNYSLVVNTNPLLKERIINEKQRFHEQYKQKAVETLPCITIANFTAKEEMEETIIRYVQRICIQQQSFEVMLNNYSGVPPHTIYLRVQNQQPFKKLSKELLCVSNYINSCACPPVKFINNLHITIATELPETIYLTALMEYAQETFHETFMVDELVLLRRTHEYDACKPINVFRLQPPGNTLFN
jgi:2'-5' RNA ligase